MNKRIRVGNGTGQYVRNPNFNPSYGTSMDLEMKQASSYRRAKIKTGRGRTALGRARAAAPQGREKKYFDNLSVAMNFNTTGSGPNCLNSIIQGVDNNQRVGRKITNLSLQWKGTIQWGPFANAQTGIYGRLIIFWDSTPEHTAPAVTDVLTAATSQAFTNINNKDRFTIIRDIDIYFGPATVTTGIPQVLTDDIVEGFVKLNMASQFDNTTAIPPATGGLFAMSIGNFSAATSNSATCLMSFRLKFLDD